MVDAKKFKVPDIQPGTISEKEIIPEEIQTIEGNFVVLITDYCDKNDKHAWLALPNMAFKLFKVPEYCEIAGSSIITTSNQYKNGYWYTDSNGSYKFEIQGGKYEIVLKTAEFEIDEINANEQTILDIKKIETNEQRFTCSVGQPLEHKLEKNPLRHTPVYRDIEILAGCLSLTPEIIINKQTDKKTIRCFQELLNWLGFYGKYTHGKSGGDLDGDYGPGTIGGVKDFQQLCLSSTPKDLPPPRTDGYTDGLTVLAMATSYRDKKRKRKEGEPGNRGTKVLVKVVDSLNQKIKLREDAAWSFHQYIEEVECKGGIIDLATGGYVPLDADRPLGAGRTLTSLHNTGRAVDHNNRIGMQDLQIDKYVIERVDNNDPPRWVVWSKCNKMRGQNKELNGWVYEKGGGKYKKINGYFINITDIAKKHNIEGISGRTEWKTNKDSTEWWHFEYKKDFTTWRQEMNIIGYPDDKLKDYLNQVLIKVKNRLQVASDQDEINRLNKLKQRLEKDAPNFNKILNSR